MNEINNKYKLFTNKLCELNINLIEHYLFSSDNKLFDAKNRRIGNVDDPLSDLDVVNKRYVDRIIFTSGDKYDCIIFNDANKYYFEENLNDNDCNIIF